jgi:hypothetical protein
MHATYDHFVFKMTSVKPSTSNREFLFGPNITYLKPIRGHVSNAVRGTDEIPHWDIRTTGENGFAALGNRSSLVPGRRSRSVEQNGGMACIYWKEITIVQTRELVPPCTIVKNESYGALRH